MSVKVQHAPLWVGNMWDFEWFSQLQRWEPSLRGEGDCDVKYPSHHTNMRCRPLLEENVIYWTHCEF